MPPSEFLVARNPDADSALPYLIRLPLGPNGVVLKARDTWPRLSKVFCHAAASWPQDPEIVERVPVVSCSRRGAAIDLVLDRGRENRSQIVFTRIRGGRDAIFWQTARTAKQARPNVGLPRRRSAAGKLVILADTHERYPWRFSHQQAETVRRLLRVGDYGVELDGELVAAVERKALSDLVSSLTSGQLRYALAGLTALHRAAVVVEDRYSSVFRLVHVQPGVVAEGIAELQVQFPTVPIVFCETRALDQEWSYRFLGAALDELSSHPSADLLASELRPTGPVPTAPASTMEVRTWALGAGIAVSDRGQLRRDVWRAYEEAHQRIVR